MKRFLAALTLASLLAAAGCIHTTTPPIDRRVTIGPEQSGKVVVTDVKAAARNSDHAEVQVNLVNITGSVRTVGYRFVWLDATGLETVGPQLTPWREVTLQPQEIRALSSVAPVPEAIDFRVHVR